MTTVETGRRAAYRYCASLGLHYPVRVLTPGQPDTSWFGGPEFGTRDDIVMVYCGPEAPFPMQGPGPEALFSSVSPYFARMFVADRAYREYLRDQILSTHLPPLAAIQFSQISLGETSADWAIVTWHVWYKPADD